MTSPVDVSGDVVDSEFTGFVVNAGDTGQSIIWTWCVREECASWETDGVVCDDCGKLLAGKGEIGD